MIDTFITYIPYLAVIAFLCLGGTVIRFIAPMVLATVGSVVRLAQDLFMMLFPVLFGGMIIYIIHNELALSLRNTLSVITNL